MLTHAHKRGFFGKRGFSLIELMITIVIIGILAALLIPKLTQVGEEAHRQTARQQLKVLEKALANWYAAEPNFAQASADWDQYATNGYISNTNFFTNILANYLDANPSSPFLSYSSGGGYALTAEMQQIPVPSGGSFITDGVATPATGVTTAHVRLYWQPTVITNGAVSTDRHSYSPKVYFFLPTTN